MKNSVNFNQIGLSGLFSLTLISVLLSSICILSSDIVSAEDSVVDDISITVPISCTLSGTGMDSHTATVNSGTYEDDIGTTTLKAICNDNEGFSIYAIGYTGETYGTTTLVGSNTGQTIATGTATSGNTSNWAMKLETNSSATYPITLQNGYGSYNNVPTTYTKVAERQSATDTGTSAIGSVLTTTYATYVSSTQVADTYNGKVKYTLVHPYDAGVPPQPQPTNSGKIGYFPNASGVTDTMGDQTIGSSDVEATLWATNFKRPGYGFAGWTDQFDYDINSNSNTGHIYGPNETIGFTAGQYSGDNPGLSLYAVWVKSAGNLQGWTGCSSLGAGEVTALTDTRDNDTYAVAKLADGKCWMIENLRLDTDDSLDSSKAQGYGGTPGTYGTFSGLANPETANFSNTTPVVANSRYTSDGTNSIYNDTTNPVTLTDIGTTDYPEYRMPRYNNNNTNTDTTLNSNTNVANMTGTNQNVYGYGNYYSWHSAIANTNYYDTTTVDSNGFTPSEAANTSLCPKGWRLPYGRSTGKGATAGGFSYLDIQLGGSGTTAYSSTTPTGADRSKVWRRYPNNFLYSGYFSSASPDRRGSDGYYWSSTAYDYYRSYSLRLGSTLLYPANYGPKYYGQSIRCIADL